MPPESVTVTVPAKVNLHLGVGPLRSDGYHDLVTVFQAVSLTDEVTVRRSDSGGPLQIRVAPAGPGLKVAQVPTDESNLAAQAAAAVLAQSGVGESGATTEGSGLRIEIRKGIPVAGGMAGGSADAAAALVATDALLGASLPREELEALAAGLGSDVNFALHGGTAIGTGRGEQITPVLARGTYHWAFTMMADGLSAGDVYRRTDEMRGAGPVPEPALPEALLAALVSGDPEAVGRHLHNDLQPAAVAMLPTLDLLLELGTDYGALGAIVSGSGPTCAFLARDAEHALDLAVSLSASGLCGAVRTGSGPVVGTRIVESSTGTPGPGAHGGAEDDDDDPGPPDLHAV